MTYAKSDISSLKLDLNCFTVGYPREYPLYTEAGEIKNLQNILIIAKIRRVVASKL